MYIFIIITKQKIKIDSQPAGMFHDISTKLNDAQALTHNIKREHGNNWQQIQLHLTKQPTTLPGLPTD